MNVLVIYNEASGSSAIEESALHQSFSNRGFTTMCVAIATLNAKKADTRFFNPDIVVAAGGDGTVNVVAQYALDYSATLGVIPAGTFNNFAKDMNLPLEYEAAIDVIANGTTTMIDYATVNNIVFMNNSNIGAYPKAVRHRDKLMQRLNKPISAVIATIQAGRRLRRQKYTLLVDGNEHTIAASALFVGNNVYDVSLFTAKKRVSLNGGTLYMFALTSKRWRRILRAALAVVKGIPNAAHIESFCGEQISITSQADTTDVSIDGEIITQRFPLVYEIHKQALQVIVPTKTL